ncbi:cellobiose-specific phosphotransferase system component IIB [Breznakia blatticola]|uniref:Cellobiose-specific phosphotransferase system component IIB n=1 Tax=Breznakia blatticola TaxID=1754012 RepID=A0A4R8A659_9FIRM|nr:PTS lactose/cellobiose transporter subunit IIA [Breznakia blatticola]TDW26102.1 cellobiose-specific phosphotransferase system component IIB [Breznakia blatticola]
MDEIKIKEYATQIVSYAGTAFAHFYNSCQLSLKGDKSSSKKEFALGKKAIDLAHTVNSKLVDYEAKNGSLPFSLILIHSQDSLMNAINWQHMSTLAIENDNLLRKEFDNSIENKELIKILIICNAGMSTVILKSKLEKVAMAKGIKVDIKATTFNDLERIYMNYDIVLVSPQISQLHDEIKRITRNSIYIQLLNMTDFGLMRAEKIFDDILKQLLP